MLHLQYSSLKHALEGLVLCSVLFLAPVSSSFAQSLSVWDCIHYALAHSHDLRQRELTLDNAEASRLQAVGAFLPSVSASSGVQWNFGRAIDPETNTYTSVSTFNNGYGLSASLPVFDGLSRVHALRAARADVLMQKNALQASRDQMALDTYQAFTNVVYYQETVGLATEKLRESELLLRRTEVMEEEGLKSPADVAQMRAQVEADKLTLTRQENLRASGMLKLKEEEFVLASRTLGAKSFRIIFKEIFPNIFGQLITQTMFSIPHAIFTEAFLAFIGLGVPQPMASLGSMISDGYKNFTTHPYMIISPLIVMALLMLCFTMFADGLRDALDPKMKEG